MFLTWFNTCICYPQVNVNIKGTPDSGFDFGYLCTQPRNVRILGGPPKTVCKDCGNYIDAMILRGCTTNTDQIKQVPGIASRRWDILLMRFCNDYNCECRFPFAALPGPVTFLIV